jgi:hypothetical protein
MVRLQTDTRLLLVNISAFCMEIFNGVREAQAVMGEVALAKGAAAT